MAFGRDHQTLGSRDRTRAPRSTASTRMDAMRIGFISAIVFFLTAGCSDGDPTIQGNTTKVDTRWQPEHLEALGNELNAEIRQCLASGSFCVVGRIRQVNGPHPVHEGRLYWVLLNPIEFLTPLDTDGERVAKLGELAVSVLLRTRTFELHEGERCLVLALWGRSYRDLPLRFSTAPPGDEPVECESISPDGQSVIRSAIPRVIANVHERSHGAILPYSDTVSAMVRGLLRDRIKR
jgi:hypothetical protein